MALYFKVLKTKKYRQNKQGLSIVHIVDKRELEEDIYNQMIEGEQT